MGTPDKRRSDRIAVELPIVVSGVDVQGQDFAEPGRTIVIARYGAKILTYSKLTPEIEVRIRCLMTKAEAEARVIGRIREAPEGIYYGIELLTSEVNLWGVDFPPPEESQTAVARVLLECGRCHNREVVHLNEFEAEVLERSHSLWRYCKKCKDTNLWKQTWLKADEELPHEVVSPGTPPPGPPPPPKRTKDERKHVRVDVHMKAMIRDPQGFQEVVITEDISRGGFRFSSAKHYGEGWRVEAAIPYSEGGPNVFSSAKIRHAQKGPGKDKYTYGAQYVPWQDVWQDTSGHKER